MPDYKIISPERKRKQQYIAFGLVYAIISFAILINAATLFDYWDANWTYTALFYMVGVALFLSAAEKLPAELRKPAIQNIYGFLFATPVFMTGFIIMQQADILVVSQPLAVYLILPVFIYQLCIVATSEEIIFRGAIYRALSTAGKPVAYIGSSVLFGLFHWAAYSGNPSSILFAVMMGLLFCYLADHYNLGVAIAAHFVWNFGLMGGFMFN